MSEPAGGISIGGHLLPNRAFLAPMAGITDRPFRKLAEKFGAGLVVSEMIASAALSTGHNLMVKKLGKSGTLPHVVQLAGCEAEWMRRGAEIAHEAGADIIDINLGCPAKRVTNGYAGSALMRVPDIALKLIETVVAATPLPVTVKMRLGWDDESLNAPEIARRAVEAGAQMVTVHARTRQMFYKGTARWHLVRPVAEAVEVPVAVNGDIIDIETAREALRQSGATAVMLGRGAQGQPWRVGQIGAALDGHEPQAAPEGDDLVDLIATHYEDMMSEYGVAAGVRIARKHLGWYAEALGLALDKPTRKAFLENENPAEVLSMLPVIYSSEWMAAA